MAESSMTQPLQCSALRKGGHVMINNRPCKIVDMSTAKTGKHGGAKVHLVGIDIFTNKKSEMIEGSTHNVDVPIVQRHTHQLLDISDDGYVSLMMDNGDTKDDLKLLENDIGEKVRDMFESGKDCLITYLCAVGEEMVIDVKENR